MKIEHFAQFDMYKSIKMEKIVTGFEIVWKIRRKYDGKAPSCCARHMDSARTESILRCASSHARRLARRQKNGGTSGMETVREVPLIRSFGSFQGRSHLPPDSAPATAWKRRAAALPLRSEFRCFRQGIHPGSARAFMRSFCLRRCCPFRSLWFDRRYYVTSPEARKPADFGAAPAFC